MKVERSSSKSLDNCGSMQVKVVVDLAVVVVDLWRRRRNDILGYIEREVGVQRGRNGWSCG